MLGCAQCKIRLYGCYSVPVGIFSCIFVHEGSQVQLILIKGTIGACQTQRVLVKVHVGYLLIQHAWRYSLNILSWEGLGIMRGDGG